MAQDVARLMNQRTIVGSLFTTTTTNPQLGDRDGEGTSAGNVLGDGLDEGAISQTDFAATAGAYLDQVSTSWAENR